jgi:uncharacterized protein (TIGR03435 family)
VKPALIAVAATVAIAAGLQAVAQQQSITDQDRAFEAASIKLNRSAEAVGLGRIILNGSLFRASGTTTRALISMAFWQERRLLNSQIVGGPPWIDGDRFDVIARGDRELRGFVDAAPLLRQLLADRFQMKAHMEKREQTVYALTHRPDGRSFGPGLKASTVDCGDPALRGTLPTSPAQGAAWCGGQFGDGSIEAGGYTLAALALNLSGMTQQVVIDETGLPGRFDISLKWSPDSSAGGADGPSLYTAVEEQLGLKLEPRKAGVDVVVIDQIERPAPD